ncbi:nitroreductase family protein [Marinobacter sp. TBZ242]|uniref:Nitroreductase family protein n=1 Tax=Marinobacter azerbaijanicus TaxID=3050455 RepID=A0ABT7I9D1_9GAMM|nr:nitroreductase family protein [Marinobacter sp. TBZ242]MDL0430759.1 nitroreductase family protein [Marinobacter sp. TBZ242]
MNPEITSITQEQIRSLLSYAVLAPSSHNTQPWRFEITDGAVSVFADRTRALAANDPDDRELTISCGCALMNLRVAAAHEGIGVAVDTTPDSGDDDLLAVVSFFKEDSASADESGLFESIEGRRTYRKRFASKDVPTAVLDSLGATAAEEGSWLEVIDSEEDRQKVAELVSEGDSVQWSNPSWRRELAAWMHPRRRGDGLTVPGIVAPIAQVVVRTFDMGNGVGAKDKQLADESPVLAVLGTSGDNVADWLAAGQALEKVLLSAHAQGLQASYLNQPIQVASLRPKLQNLLGQQGFPQILLRLGFPEDDIDAAPRRRLDEVLE